MTVSNRQNIVRPVMARMTMAAALCVGAAAMVQAPAALARKASENPDSVEQRNQRLGAELLHRRDAAQAAPRDAQRRLALANAYLAAGRPGAAAATFNDAIELGGFSSDAARGWAEAQIALGRHEIGERVLAQLDQGGDKLLIEVGAWR